jgi:hypothetical protein
MQVARKVKSPDHSPMLIVSRTGQEELRIGDGGDEEGKGVGRRRVPVQKKTAGWE